MGALPCPAKFEPDAPAFNTHTCNKDAGHAGEHHCPRCGKDWLAVNWRCYWVNMAEPGYIAVHCWRDEAWDQFPLFEGKVDLKSLQDWVADHEHRHHPTEAPVPGDHDGST